MSGYYWQLKVGRKRYDPNQPRVSAGNPEGGQWTSGGGFAGSAKFGTTTGTASATARADGSIVVRKEDYAKMNDDDRRWLVGHEISHATVEDYHEKHPEEWDSSKRLLYRETVQRGRYEGFDAFYPWTINLSEAVAEALTAHLLGRDGFSNMPQEKWNEFRSWASGLSKRGGYSDDALRRDIERVKSQLDGEL